MFATLGSNSRNFMGFAKTSTGPQGSYQFPITKGCSGDNLTRSPSSDSELQVPAGAQSLLGSHGKVHPRQAAPDPASPGELEGELDSKRLSPMKSPLSCKARAGHGPPSSRGPHPRGNAVPADRVAPEGCAPAARRARTSSA